MVIYIRSDAQGFSNRKRELVVAAKDSCLGSFLRDPRVPRHLSGARFPLLHGEYVLTISGSLASC